MVLFLSIIGASENSIKELFCLVNEITPGVRVFRISGSENETTSTLESLAEYNWTSLFRDSIERIS